MRTGMPSRPWEQSGSRPRAHQLGAREGAQGPRGEPGAQRQGHARRRQRIGRCHAAAPRRAGREVGVGRMHGVAQQQRLEVLDARAQECLGPWVVAHGPCRGKRTRGSARHGPDGTRTGRPYPQLHASGVAGRQVELPSEQPRGGQCVRGRRVGRDDGVPRGAGPSHARVVNAGGQVRTGSPGGDRAQFRQVRAERHLDGQAQMAVGRAAQGDPLRAVRVSRPFDDDIRVGAAVGGQAQGRHETGLVGRDHPGLDRERLPPRDAQSASGEHASARAVEALQPLSGQLAVLRGDREPGQRDTDQRAVRGGQIRCGGRQGQGCLRSCGTAGGYGELCGPAGQRVAVVRSGGLGGQGHGAASSVLRALSARSAGCGGLRKGGVDAMARPGRGLRHTGERSGPVPGHAPVHGSRPIGGEPRAPECGRGCSPERGARPRAALTSRSGMCGREPGPAPLWRQHTRRTPVWGSPPCLPV